MTLSSLKEIMSNGGKYPIIMFFITGIVSGIVGSIYPVMLSDVLGVDGMIMITSIGSLLGFFLSLLISKLDVGKSAKKMIIMYMFFLMTYDTIVFLSVDGVIKDPFIPLAIGNSFVATSIMKRNELFEYLSMYQLGLKNRAKFTSVRTMAFHFGQIVGALLISILPFYLAFIFIMVARIMFAIFMRKLRDVQIEKRLNFRFERVGKYFIVIVLFYLALGIFILTRGVYVDRIFGRKWVGVYMALNYSMLLFGVPYGLKFVVSGNIPKRVAIPTLITGLLFIITSGNPYFTAIFAIAAVFMLNISIWGVRHIMFKSVDKSKTHGIIFIVYMISMFSRALMGLAVIAGVNTSLGFMLLGSFAMVVGSIVLLFK